MYLNIFFVNLLFIIIIYYADADESSTQPMSAGCSVKILKCEASGKARRPVCGSDFRTYATRCHLLRAQCLGEQLTMAHKGPCKDERLSACRIALNYAMKVQGTRRATFIPRCRSDGSYAAVQCSATGAAASCWCVNPAGKPLPNTAVRNGRPDCTKTGKSQTRRRSSTRRQRNKKLCSRSDRSLFNSNLLKIFSNEYDRYRTGGEETKSITRDAKMVADWKFGELDKDESESLQKPEYRGLRRVVKKVVKPKRCARVWMRNCDLDSDGIILKSEWMTCLLVLPKAPTPDHVEGGAEPEHEYPEEEILVESTAVLPGSLMRGAVAAEGTDVDTRRDDENNDCLTDRQFVLDEQKAGGTALYVPECTGDGRYARAQCYKSTGYCWCVHQDTGKPIPGSSVKDMRPDCDSAPHHASPMRGCPEPKRTQFLQTLRTFFVSKMILSTNGSVPGLGEMGKWSASREEHAATWVFVMLDKDKNKVIDRREWKAFYQLINSNTDLRKCGKKLPRHCDVNHDNKISITEWMACIDVATNSKPFNTDMLIPSSSTKRKGPNPLESILKADD